jgi:hypothetical protein
LNSLYKLSTFYFRRMTDWAQYEARVKMAATESPVIVTKTTQTGIRPKKKTQW